MQKYKLRLEKENEQTMKEQKTAAQEASSRNWLTMQEPAARIPSSSYWNHTFGTYEKANSTAMGNWLANSTPPYGFGLLNLNQLASEQNNELLFAHLPYTQLNFVEWPVVSGRRNMNNNSNREADMEALLKNPVIPLIDLTDDNNSEQQQNNGAFVTAQLNFNLVANSNWPNNDLRGAMYAPISGDGLWGLTWGNVAENYEQNNVQQVVVQNPNNAHTFVNPLNNIPNKMSLGSSEQNILCAVTVDKGSNKNTVMPAVGEPLLGFKQDSSKIDEFFDDEVDCFLNDDPDVIGSAEGARLVTKMALET